MSETEGRARPERPSEREELSETEGRARPERPSERASTVTGAILRVVGIDLGERRIGVAVSAGELAVPHGTVERSGDPDADRATLARLIVELDADRVVVGLPLLLDGTVGPAARHAEDEATALRALVAVPVELFDERLSTVSAGRSLATAGVRGKARRRVVDQVAATVFLQAWLDQRQGRTEEA